MTKIKNKFQLKQYMHYNQYTGQFTRIQAATAGRDALGTVSGPKAKQGQIRLHGVWYELNRLAFLYMTGEYPKGIVRHIDGSKENLAWSNLKDVVPIGGRIAWIERRGRYQVYSGKKYVGSYKTRPEAEVALNVYLNCDAGTDA
jgi:hypothetical protein